MSTQNQTNPQNNYRSFCVNEQKEPRFLAKRNKILETTCAECRLNLKKMMFPFTKRSKNLQDWRIIESGTFFTMQIFADKKLSTKIDKTRIHSCIQIAMEWTETQKKLKKKHPCCPISREEDWQQFHYTGPGGIYYWWWYRQSHKDNQIVICS